MKKGFIIIAILVLCLLPISAFSNITPQQPGSHNQCVTKLAPLRTGQHTSRILGFHCYNTFAAAIADATGGLVHLASSVRPQNLTQAMLDAVQHSTVRPQTLYVLSVEYWDWHYQGATWTTSGSLPCDQVGGYGDNSLGSWDNEISSSIGYNNCNNNTHWDNSNFSGSDIVCSADCYEMGAMNDATSAIQWHS